MNENISKRENWIDWSKAILIWLMVLGHAGLSGVPREFVYAFHMPAFFIISGYLYKPHNCLRTLKSFGIPILFFSAINLSFVLLKMSMKGESIMLVDLLGKITPPYYKCNFGEYITLFRGVWFVVVLFLMRLLMGDLPGLSSIRKYVCWLIPILVVYMSIEPLFYNYTNSLHGYYAYKVIGCMPFMMLGVLLRENKSKLMSLSKSILFVLLVIYISFTLWNGDVDIWLYTFGKGYFLFFVGALVASILLFNLCNKLKASKIALIFSKGTLLILGLHDPILEICNKCFDVLHLPHLSIVSSLVVMLLCYYLIKMALKYCPMVLGK